MSGPKTIIVVPCFNEAARFDVAAFSAFMEAEPDIGFLFVNDGSSDGTLEVLQGIVARGGGRSAVLDLKQNRGKAEAVRAGVLECIKSKEYRTVGFWDADLATPLKDIPVLSAAIAGGAGVKMATGCRIMRLGSNVSRRWYRHYLGRLFATIAAIILRLPVYDTQCGAKLFDAALAGQLFAEPFITRWLFDVELFARVTRRFGREGTRRMVYEVPLPEWDDRKGSKLGLKYYLLTPYHLARIAVHYGLLFNRRRDIDR